MEPDAEQQPPTGEPDAGPTRRRLRLGRRGLLVILAATAVIAGAGAAIAATQQSTPAARNQAIIADAAGRLGIQPSRLATAVRQALIDQINKAVAAGTIPRAQADALIARIKAGTAPLFGGGRGWGRHHPGGFGLGGRPAIITAAASYLGLTPNQLLTQLVGGKSLAAIATARGRTAAGLKQALVTAVTARLDQRVTNGSLTRTDEQATLTRLSASLDRIIQRVPRLEQPGVDGAPDLGSAGPAGPSAGAPLPPLVAPA